MGAEAKMRDGIRARFLRVVDEVALRVAGRVGGENLHGILVGAHRAVGAETKEQRAHDLGRFNVEVRIDLEAGVRDIIDDPDGERMLRVGLGELVEHRLRHRRVEIL